ncbi:MAG: helix-turn-helix transcriptional regulator, partial [Deltaproteobacteria bacterium]|nr:helix-turn-helix transcriptional regulator [Deltaproteobacteria bacterium]
KSETGINFTEYLIHFRIEKAKELLLNTSKNISEIAYEVGFNSQSYFGYLFKKCEKISPGKFILSNQKR